MPETMKCPFRQDEQGEFQDCIGKVCMAYCEFETCSYDDYRTTGGKNTFTARMCKRMPQPVTYLAGCAI